MSLYSSSALEDSAVVASEECFVKKIVVHNSGATAKYVLLFDAASLPANTTVALAGKRLAANGDVEFDFSSYGEHGRKFNTGCVVAGSSTGGVLTVVIDNNTHIFADGSVER